MRSNRSERFAHVLAGVLAVALVTLLPTRTVHAAQTLFFVRPGGLTSGSCDSWANACELRFILPTANLAAAIGGVPVQVWAEAGTYKPNVSTDTDRSKTFLFQASVALYGGFIGTETDLSQRDWVTNVTILSGDIGTVGYFNDNSYYVVVASSTNSTTILDGLTIQDGYGGPGAGMYISAGSPTVRNVTFIGNATTTNGGGMYTGSGSSPTLTNVTFWLNAAGGRGGGMYNDGSSPTLTDVTFHANSADYGGGMFSENVGYPTLTRVTFTGNTASSAGGGMDNEFGSGATLTSVTFSGNQSNSYPNSAGGGLYNINANPTLTSVTFSGNSTSGNGGGLYSSNNSAVLNNVTFSGNQAAVGGGVYVDSGTPTLRNNTFSGNVASANGGGLYNAAAGQAIIYDSIFWLDNTEVWSTAVGQPSITDSIVQGGCQNINTCLRVSTANPALGVLRNNGGFAQTMALGAGSAAIDRGNKATCAAKDARGVVRPQGPSCDMGAYEVRVLLLTSQAGYDGQVLESGENSSGGGSPDSLAATIRVGDDALNRQYRGFLSFNTGGLPDTATVVLARLQLTKQVVVGSNPFANHGYLLIDLRKPYFGTGPGLVSADFQAVATVSSAGSVGSPLVSGAYTGLLNSAGRANISRTGVTQLRLRFSMDDDNDHLADYVSLYSGNYSTSASYRPKLTVYYNP